MNNNKMNVLDVILTTLIIVYVLTLKTVKIILKIENNLQAKASKSSLRIMAILCIVHTVCYKCETIVSKYHEGGFISTLLIAYCIYGLYSLGKRIKTYKINNFIVSSFYSHKIAYENKHTNTYYLKKQHKFEIKLSIMTIIISLIMLHFHGIIEAISALSLLEIYYNKNEYRKKFYTYRDKTYNFCTSCRKAFYAFVIASHIFFSSLYYIFTKDIYEVEVLNSILTVCIYRNKNDI